MTEEAKNTIDWIKKILKNGETRYSIEESDYEANEQSAINLLDKIENLEKYLQLGGLIQDVNKKWCKHRDHILVKNGEEYKEEVIKWSSNINCFFYHLKDDKALYHIEYDTVFSKIEDQNEAAE